MCCGHGRKQLSHSFSTQVSAPPSAPQQPSTSILEYLGSTALTVFGPVTRAQYRFAHPGAQVQVDVRDQAALARIPVLRQVR